MAVFFLLLICFQQISENIGKQTHWKPVPSDNFRRSAVRDGYDAPNRPFFVKLKDKNGYYCGGSLISKDYVITAGHCVQGKLRKFPVFLIQK